MKQEQLEDRYLHAIGSALAPYREKHANAVVDAKRQNSACVRVRVIDPDFRGMNRADRDSLIWTYLATMPEAVQSEISMLVLVTPQEKKNSLANLEFEHPTPSAL